MFLPPFSYLKSNGVQNEIYYSLSTTAVIAPGAILSPCIVSNNLQPTIIKRKPGVYALATPSKRQGSSKDTNPSLAGDDSTDDDENEDTEEVDAQFYCRLAVDSRRGLFYEFAWERHRKDALSRAKLPVNNSGPCSTTLLDHSWELGGSWIVEEKLPGGSSDAKTKRKVKARRVKNDNASQQGEISESDVDDSENEERTGSDNDSFSTIPDSNASGEGEDSEDNATAEPRTPSRKRKRKEEKMSRKLKRSLAQPTPHSKAALVRRQKIGPSPRKRKVEPSFGISFSSQSLTFKTSMAHLPKDPWLRAMHALHVGSRPDSLPCREEEFNKVLRCISELLEEGSGGCVCKPIFILYIYFSGMDWSIRLQIFRESQELGRLRQCMPL